MLTYATENYDLHTMFILGFILKFSSIFTQKKFFIHFTIFFKLSNKQNLKAMEPSFQVVYILKIQTWGGVSTSY